MQKLHLKAGVIALSVIVAIFGLIPMNPVYVFADSEQEDMKATDYAKPKFNISSNSTKSSPNPDKTIDSDGKPVLKKHTPAEEGEGQTHTRVDTDTTWMIIGAGVAAVGAIGLAIGSSSGGDGDSNSGAGSTPSPTPTPKPTPEIVGPDLNGGDWSGSILYKDVGEDRITATITHVGDQVTIETSRPADSLGHLLTGTITSSGNMYMFDAADGEEWTSLYGPASSNSFALADYVFEGFVNTGTNILKLRR